MAQRQFANGKSAEMKDMVKQIVSTQNKKIIVMDTGMAKQK
jgi:uncharacterized protein (DUF305 family)